MLDHLAAGVPTLLEIDLSGARQVRAQPLEAQFVFLAPPSLDELVHRLAGRGTESPAALADRLARAELEMAAAPEFDHVVVNTTVAARPPSEIARAALNRHRAEAT